MVDVLPEAPIDPDALVEPLMLPEEVVEPLEVDGAVVAELVSVDGDGVDTLDDVPVLVDGDVEDDEVEGVCAWLDVDCACSASAARSAAPLDVTSLRGIFMDDVMLRWRRTSRACALLKPGRHDGAETEDKLVRFAAVFG